MEKEKGKVFISYSHYSHAHCDLVLAFADLLRKYKIDAVLDQYESCTSEGWPKWVNIQVKLAEFVLIICSRSYWEHANGIKENGCGKGVYFESTIIYNQISAEPQNMNRFIPVLFNKGDTKYVPAPVIGNISYCVDNKEGAEALYRRLTHQPPVQKPELGKDRVAIPTDPQCNAFADQLTRLVKEAYEPGTKKPLVSHGLLSPTIMEAEVKRDPIFTAVQEMLKRNYDFSGGLIATGTYSRVYLVHHKIFDEDHVLKLMNFNLFLRNIGKVDIKIIKEAFDKKKKMFEKEAKFFYSLQGAPNILGYVRLDYVLYEYREEVFEIPYLLSRYIKGVSLRDFIRSEKPLDWDHIYNLSIKILSTIEAIQKKGFFYWNIRPEKIIVEEGSHNTVFLDADMPEHISSLTDLSGTNIIINRDLYNTLFYLSPIIDRMNERETETASIICLFGLLLYEMATQDKTVRDKFNFFSELNKKFNSPGFELERNPGLPDGIAGIIKKTITPMKGQRYRDIEEVLNDLRNVKEIPQNKA